MLRKISIEAPFGMSDIVPLQHLYPEREGARFQSWISIYRFGLSPGEVKGAIEIQGYGSAARGLDV
jgi:hypothetical protein